MRYVYNAIGYSLEHFGYKRKLISAQTVQIVKSTMLQAS